MFAKRSESAGFQTFARAVRLALVRENIHRCKRVGGSEKSSTNSCPDKPSTSMAGETISIQEFSSLPSPLSYLRSTISQADEPLSCSMSKGEELKELVQWSMLHRTASLSLEGFHQVQCLLPQSKDQRSVNNDAVSAWMESVREGLEELLLPGVETRCPPGLEEPADTTLSLSRWERTVSGTVQQRWYALAAIHRLLLSLLLAEAKEEYIPRYESLTQTVSNLLLTTSSVGECFLETPSNSTGGLPSSASKSSLIDSERRFGAAVASAFGVPTAARQQQSNRNIESLQRKLVEVSVKAWQVASTLKPQTRKPTTHSDPSTLAALFVEEPSMRQRSDQEVRMLSSKLSSIAAGGTGF
jgi:hypothetical protein